MVATPAPAKPVQPASEQRPEGVFEAADYQRYAEAKAVCAARPPTTYSYTLTGDKPMVAGAKNRYGKGLTVKHGEVQDRRPVTGTETIPADQVRTAPRVTVQAPNRHPGSVPAKNMAATAAARPAADPVQRHVQQSGIPHHRTEPTHRPAESEEQTLVHGYPVNKRKLQAFSELLKATETRISDDPRAVGPAVRELGDQMLKMHLAHVDEMNKGVLAEHEEVQFSRRPHTLGRSGQMRL